MYGQGRSLDPIRTRYQQQDKMTSPRRHNDKPSVDEEVLNITNPGSWSQATMEKSVKCVSCQNFFDNADHIPHVLPCLHSCCSSCLNKFVKDSKNKCPECQEPLQNGDDGSNDISKFPIDVSKKHLVDFYRVKKSSDKILCDQCEDKSAAARCKECQEFLCRECTQTHESTEDTNTHSVVTLEKLRTLPIGSFHSKPTCSVPGHKGQALAFFCTKSTCNRPICKLCRSDHPEGQGQSENGKSEEEVQGQGHVVRNINEIYVQNKRLTEGYLIHLKNETKSIDKTIARMENERERVKQTNDEAEQELEESFQSCFRALEVRKQELTERFRTAREDNERQLERQIADTHAERRRLHQTCRFAEERLSYSGAAEFLTVKDPVINRVSTLSENDVSKIKLPSTSGLQFVPRGLAEEFKKSIPALGDVWTTSAHLPNTKVETTNIHVDKEETALTITLHDKLNKQLDERGVDIIVTVRDSRGKTSEANVKDCVETEGCYKVTYLAERVGEYRADVVICGTPLDNGGYPFNVLKVTELTLDLSTLVESSKADGITDTSSSTGDSHSHTTGSTMTASSSSRKDKDIYFPDFSFDRRRCYIQNSVSKDKLQLTNEKPRHLLPRIANRNFKTYRGTIGTKPLGEKGQQYFEVQIHFFIKRQMRQELVFEIGVSSKSCVDNHYTIDCHPDSWVFCGRRCAICDSICLQAWHDSSKLYHTSLTAQRSPGTTFRAIYGFLLDTEEKQLYIIDAKSKRCMFRFRNVDTSKPLWPTFGIYNPDMVSVTMTLRSGNSITSEPDIRTDTGRST